MTPETFLACLTFHQMLGLPDVLFPFVFLRTIRPTPINDYEAYCMSPGEPDFILCPIKYVVPNEQLPPHSIRDHTDWMSANMIAAVHNGKTISIPLLQLKFDPTDTTGQFIEAPFAQGKLQAFLPSRRLPDPITVVPNGRPLDIRDTTIPPIHTVAPRLSPEQRRTWIKRGMPVPAAVNITLPERVKKCVEEAPMPDHQIRRGGFKDT